MVSFDVRQTLRMPVKILALAAAAAPCTGFPQPAPLGNDALDRLFDRIEEAQAENGPHSATLLDPLTALGLRYQENGDHSLAAVVIERALQVVRVNYGLHSLDQAPLIRQSIENETARGNLAGAWELEQGLLTLARRHPEDLRTVPILREIGDKRMAVLDRYVAGESPPEVTLGCFLRADIGSCTSGSKAVAIRSIAMDAQRNYARAIQVMLRHKLYSSEELQDLEMELVRSSFVHGHYGLGRQRLRALAAYDVANAELWLTRMDGLIEIADWDLLFSQNGLALETYEAAHEQLLIQEGIAPASIERIFSPAMPIVLPTFLSNPLASNETPASTGYIDVAFEITKYGRARRLEVLDTTTNATNDAKADLIHMILRNRFRPRATGGEIATSPVVVRYYLNEQQLSVAQGTLCPPTQSFRARPAAKRGLPPPRACRQ